VSNLYSYVYKYFLDTEDEKTSMRIMRVTNKSANEVSYIDADNHVGFIMVEDLEDFKITNLSNCIIISGYSENSDVSRIAKKKLSLHLAQRISECNKRKNRLVKLVNKIKE